MTTAVQRRRGTTTEHASFTGLEGEISVNTTKETLVVHDGATVGGFELARADGSNFVASTVDINGGTIDGTTIGASSASTGAFTTLTASGEITANGGIALGDNDKATFGASDDLQIYSDGDSSFINEKSSSGSLFIEGDNIRFRTTDTSKTYALFTNSGSVRLYHDNSNKLETTATGIDVTGTATMDGLTVGSASGVFPSEVLQIRGNGGTSGYVNGFGLGASNAQFRIFADDTNNTAGSIKFDIRNRDRILIEDSGDISFYEDTGTTPKFFWDASAESLGIGTTPTNVLHVKATADTDGATIIGLSPTATNNIQGGLGCLAGGELQVIGTNQTTFWTAATQRMVIDSAGNVGIGGTPTTHRLEVKGDNNIAKFYSDATATELKIAAPTVNVIGLYTGTADALTFGTADTERARLDSSGNLGIGVSPNASARLHIGKSGASPELWLERTDGYLPTKLIGNTLGNGQGFKINVAGTDALAIDSSGRVGIGTSSPSAKLSIYDASSADSTGLVISNGYTTDAAGDTTEIMFQHYRSYSPSVTDSAFIKAVKEQAWDATNTRTSALAFGTRNGATEPTEAMRISSSGRVGIGCVPQANLDIDVAVDTSLGLRSQTGVIVAQYTGAPAVGNRAQIGLGYGNTYTNVSIGAVRTSATAYGTDDFIIATKSGTADTAPTERLRIDSSGNLLVGKTSSALGTEGIEARATGFIRATVDSADCLQLNRLSTDGDIIDFRKDGTSVGSIGTFGGYQYIIGGNAGGTHAGLRFINNASIRPCGSTGNDLNATLDLGTSAARFKDLYLSGGVYLGGTGAANKLDDYEEGTWTPTVYGTATAGTATYAQRVGTYTKVGNLVYLQAYVIFSSFTGTSEMRISGLPFTPEGGSYENHMGSIILNNIALPAGSVQVTPRALDGQTFLDFRVTVDNAGSTFVSCDAAGEILISITYRSA